jgi:hypothetical protein
MESAEQIKNYLPGCVLRNRSRRRAAHQSRVTVLLQILIASLHERSKTVTWRKRVLSPWNESVM